MTLADFYLFCFAFGFLFAVVTVISGHLHLDMGDGHGHDIDFHHDGAGHDASAHHVSPWNLGTGAAFLAWFGGTGYLATKFYRLWFVSTLFVAVAAGVLGAWLVYLFLAKVLMRTREDMNPADYDMVGVLGNVSDAIRAGGIGEILFSRDGARRASAARSEDGSAIQSGEEVVVTRYENGIAYVRRWSDLV